MLIVTVFLDLCYFEMFDLLIQWHRYTEFMQRIAIKLHQ